MSENRRRRSSILKSRSSLTGSAQIVDPNVTQHFEIGTDMMDMDVDSDNTTKISKILRSKRVSFAGTGDSSEDGKTTAKSDTAVELCTTRYFDPIDLCTTVYPDDGHNIVIPNGQSDEADSQADANRLVDNQLTTTILQNQTMDLTCYAISVESETDEPVKAKISSSTTLDRKNSRYGPFASVRTPYQNRNKVAKRHRRYGGGLLPLKIQELSTIFSECSVTERSTLPMPLKIKGSVSTEVPSLSCSVFPPPSLGANPPFPTSVPPHVNAPVPVLTKSLPVESPTRFEANPPPSSLHNAVTAPPPLVTNLAFVEDPLPISIPAPPATLVRHPLPISIQAPPATLVQDPLPISIQAPPATLVQDPLPISIQALPATLVEDPLPISIQAPPETLLEDPLPISIQAPPATLVEDPLPISIQAPPATLLEDPLPISIQAPPETLLEDPLPISIQAPPATLVEDPLPIAIQAPPATLQLHLKSYPTSHDRERAKCLKAIEKELEEPAAPSSLHNVTPLPVITNSAFVEDPLPISIQAPTAALQFQLKSYTTLHGRERAKCLKAIEKELEEMTPAVLRRFLQYSGSIFPERWIQTTEMCIRVAEKMFN